MDEIEVEQFATHFFAWRYASFLIRRRTLMDPVIENTNLAEASSDYHLDRATSALDKLELWTQ